MTNLLFNSILAITFILGFLFSALMILVHHPVAALISITISALSGLFLVKS